MIFNSNKIIILLCLFWVFIGFLPSNARAVPAAPDASEVHQPDGTPIKAFVKGDEWKNWVETVDGYTIAQDNNANWFYVLEFEHKTPLLDLTPADRSPPPQLKKHIRPQADSHGARHINEESMDRQPGISSDGEPVNSSYRMIDAPYGSFSGSILFILAEFSNRSGGG